MSNQPQPPRPSSSQYPPPPTTHQFIPQTGQTSRQSQHRRALSGSSASASVDETILEAADNSQGSQGTQPSNGHAPSDSNTRSRKRHAPSTDQEVTYESHQRASPHHQPPPPVPRSESSSSPMYRHVNGSLQHLSPAESGPREIKMHVFAPVVTGAPQKKAKFSGATMPSLSTASVRNEHRDVWPVDGRR